MPKCTRPRSTDPSEMQQEKQGSQSPHNLTGAPHCTRKHTRAHTHTEGGPDPSYPLECLWHFSQALGARESGWLRGGSSSSLLIGCLTGVYPITVDIHGF